ncbi:U3 snoRNP protein, partial [Gryganskiella cystojenkinii]
MRTKERDGTVYVPPLAKKYLHASDDESFDLISMVDEFLSSDQKVLLLLGGSGTGKTTFNQELDLKLWKTYMDSPKTTKVPLLISLSAIDRPEKDLIAKHLRICDFSEPQIREMKDRELVIICDGYDECQQSRNLYESNEFNKDGGWRVQMIVSCRSEHLGEDYLDLFQPSRASPVDPDLFKQAVLVPFSSDQIKDYIARYVSIKRPLWVASDYQSVLDQIPSLQDLVKNPFLLSLSLEVLPLITDPDQKLTTNKITRVSLYDELVTRWLERNKERCASQDLSNAERNALASLAEDGFTQQGLRFLKDLSVVIYNEQGGNPVVDYDRDRDAGTWKERFFGRRDEETQLLRKAIPMTRNGSRFGFIHRSILEYGVSRAIYAPQQQTGLRLEAPVEFRMYQPRRRKSTDSAYSFEMDLGEATETAITTTMTGPSMDSPLARRNFIKDPSVMQFLVERVQAEPPFKDQLFGFIEASKTDKKWRTAAANAITILVKAGVYFTHHDLRGIQVPGADMSFGAFDSAQLQGADLRKTNLEGVWFRQVDLSRARMEGSRFGEWPTLKKMSHTFAYTLDGKAFVAGTEDGKIIVYNASTWSILAIIQGHDRPVTHIAISRDGSLLASGSDDADIADEALIAKIWNLKTGDFLHALEGHTRYFAGLIFLPSGQRVITGSLDRAIHLWEVKSGVRLHSFEVQPDHAVVSAIACSNDGALLASSYLNETVRLWDIETSECLHVLTGLQGHCPGITFSPCGKTLALTTIQGIKTWDVTSGKELWTFEEPMTTNGPAVYSPD